MKKFVSGGKALVVGSLAVVGTAAQAAVPESVTTAITAGVADVGTIGAAILGVVIVIVGFNWLRRTIK